MVLAACSDAESSKKVSITEPRAEVSELTPLTLEGYNNRYELNLIQNIVGLQMSGIKAFI